MDAQALLRASA